MKKLLTALLALGLALSLAAPGLAYEDTDPPLWTLARYADRGSFEDYLFQAGLTETEYAEMAEWVCRYLAEHPEDSAAFDADAWFEEKLCYPPGNPSGKANWFSWQLPSYTEADFQKEMRYDWLTGLYRVWQEAQSSLDVSAQYPEEYAAFDADAWFAGYYGGILSVSKASYMQQESLPDEEGFRRAMFTEWYSGTRGRYNGVTVTAAGTPIQFQTVRDAAGETALPISRDGRILVPARTIAEALGFAIGYDASSGTVTCSGAGRTVRFTIDRTDYTVTIGEEVRLLSLDVPACAENGRTYLPLRALAEALGHTVTWIGPFHTAALTA